MAYIKPQVPLKVDNDYIYPLTTIDQVILPDSTRLNAEIENIKSQLGLNMDLLWTNASPTSAIGDVDITLDLTNYRLVSVVFKGSVYNNNYQFATYENIDGLQHVTDLHNLWSSQTNTKVAVREYSIFSNKIYFGKGYIYTSLTTTDVNNNVIIPLKIYGIK